MIIKIGSDVITRTENDVDFTVSNSEQGDILKIDFTNNKDTEYTPNLFCTVEYLDEMFFMIVDSDELIKVNATTYVHRLNLKSAIFYFDNFYPPNRVFSQIGEENKKTLKDVLTIYAETTEYGRQLYTFDDLDDYNLKITEKEYDGQNLSTILIDLFRRIDAFPMMKREDGVLKIFPRYKGKFKDKITPKAEAYQTNIDTVSYASRVMANIKNAIYENDKGTWFPTPKGSITPRTDDYIFSESTARYILDSDITWLYEVLHPVEVGYRTEAGGVGEDFYIDYTLDVTEVFKPREVYETLTDPPEPNYPVTPEEPGDGHELNQANVVPFDLGGKEIGPLLVPAEGGWFWQLPRRLLRNAILTAFYNRKQEIIDFIESETGETVTFLQHPYEFSTTSDKHYSWEETPLRFRILSQRDISYTIEKQDVKDEILATTLSNQQSSRVEIQQHKRALSRLANRLGERHRVLTERFKNGETLPKIGDWTDDGYIVTNIRYVKSTASTKCVYEMNKHFANIDAETSISSQAEPFTISGKRIKTNTQTHEYVELSHKKKDVESFLTELGRNTVLNTFNYNESYDVPLTSAFFVNKDILPPKLLFNVPLIGGDGDVITIHNKYDHPTLAYSAIRKNDFSNLGTWQKENVVYTDANGVVDTFRFRYGRNFEYEDDLSQELLPFPQVSFSGQELIDVDNIKINLDPNATLAHTHNIHFVTDDARRIINTGGFSQLNSLHSELGANYQIKLYHRDTPYNLDSMYINELDTEDEGANVFYDDRELDIMKTDAHEFWCLAIEDRILFAYNYDEHFNKKLYINFLKKRDDYVVFGIEFFNAKPGTHVQGYQLSGNIILSKAFYDIEGGTHTQDYHSSGSIELSKVFYEIDGGTHTQNYNLSAQIQATSLSYDITGGTLTQTYQTSGDIELSKVFKSASGTHVQSYNTSGNIALTFVSVELQGTHTQTYKTDGVIGYQVATSAPEIITAQAMIGVVSVEVRNNDSDTADILLGFDENTNDEIITNVASGSSLSTLIDYSGPTPSTLYARSIASGKLVSLLVTRNIN